MTAIIPTLTQAGIQAVFNASKTGLQAEITHIALGDSGYMPTDSATALQSEKQRVAVSGGEAIGHDQIHLTATASGEAKYWIKEVGFYLADGTLLAVYSDPIKAIAHKSASLDILLSFDLKLSVLPANSVTVDGTGGVSFPPATKEKQGIMRFATDAAVSPLQLSKLNPTGTVLSFAAATPPEGFLECDGAAVQRTVYAKLYGIIGTSFGSGNGSSTFNIPDLRGEFIRGWDNGRGVDSGRSLGNWQKGSLQFYDCLLYTSPSPRD